MPFLKNCWYVAAWSDEIVAGALIGRRILNEAVVLRRDGSGKAAALQGWCPHRFAPLALGKIVDGDIQCPYHGLRFNASGECTFNPQSEGPIPKSLRIKSYPILERYGAVWIWMGESALADSTPIPDYPFLDDARLARIQGYIYSKANYELMSDNILDLGHVDFLHPGSLGCEATARAKPEVDLSGDTVRCARWMPNDFQGPLTSMLFDHVDERVDAWLDVQWHAPALMTLTFGMTDVGAAKEAGRETLNVHFMTPETDTTTHYFWAGTRGFRTDDAALSAQMLEGGTLAFTLEDKPMIEAQQAMMGATDLFSLKPVMLAGDAAPVYARRVLARLIEVEQATACAAE